MDAPVSVTSMIEQDRQISEIVAEERSRLRNFIRRRVPDPSDAEDIVQEVFYELTGGRCPTQPKLRDLEKRRWRNFKSFAQFLNVRLVERTFLMQDFGDDAFRSKNGHQILLAQLIRF